MASKALFDRLFIFPKTRYNFYIGPHMISTPVLWNPDNSKEFLMLHALTVKDWTTDTVECLDWVFSEEAWTKAEVHNNKIFIECPDGEEVTLTFYQEHEMIL